MNRILIALAALLTFVTAVYAQEHGAVARPEKPATKWFTYTSPEGKYSVSVTEPPKLSTQNINAASGDTLVQYMAGISAEPAFLMVGYFDYPQSMTFSLDSARDGMVNSLHGNLVNEDSISLGGSPGRAIKILAKTEGGMDFIDRAHFYDINRRIYILQCLVPVSNEGPGATQICNQFFDSFRIKTSAN